IPNSYSRFGHVDQSYQMTQWYPKPAVYDVNGWHTMPYLDLGEFYSEFGSFDVSITLPKNYVVGASGTLQTPEEVVFLQEKVVETAAYFANGGGERISRSEARKEDVFPASSQEMKTIRYTAEQVHDFAWFADKRFKVQKSEVTLASGRKIDTWTMFTRAEDWLWKESIGYVDRSVEWYSEKVGEYPYPQATAVQSALSAGAGMEYPMITVIGYSGNAESLDMVITHEVGHNWFYGILGTNERDYAWMDEGLNSFYESWYNEKYYGSSGLEDTPKFLNPDTTLTFDQLIYLFRANAGLDQAPQTSSDRLSVINYQLGAYTKPSLSLHYLKAYLGEARFQKAMQSYYETWKFKHPQPKDFRAAMEASTGESLAWFFEGLMESTDRIDYAIQKATVEGTSVKVVLKNQGDLASPVLVQTRSAN
ncbi:MAG: M1 family metallopeptidase, partial [Bacteroidota bacterium]